MGKLSGIKKALDMSKEARMKRARDMGFDTDNVYTHSGRSFDEIKKSGFVQGKYQDGGLFDGVFASPGDSSRYGGGDVETQFVFRRPVADSRDIDLDYDKSMATLKKEYPDESDEFYENLYEWAAEDRSDPWDNNILEQHGFADPGEASWEAQRLRGRIAADQAFDAISMSDEFGDTSVLIPAGSKARSVNAAFDPAKKDSANLLAGASAAAVGTGAMLGADDADASAQIIEYQQAQEVKRRGQQFLQRRRAKQDHFKGLREGIYKALELAEMPQQGLMALTRLGYDMATGNENALQNAARVATQRVDDTAQEFGDYVYDQTGSPAAATAGYVGANVLSPL